VKLLAKFNLILILLFGAGSVIIGLVAYTFLMRNARNQVVQQAELMIESARATRQYTADDLAPLLETVPDHATRFLPETIPFYAATVTFDHLRKKYPDYSYKEAAIIDYFRNNGGATELAGERDTPAGRMLYIAHPIATEPGCLPCHSDPQQAPPTILRKYGSVNGFGWKTNEVIAAQIVSVPMAVPVRIAGQAFRTLLIYLVLGLAAAVAMIDTALLFLVIRPVRKLSGMANQISNGDMSLPELPVHGKDEIAGATASFNRMLISLQKAFKMLNG
jgi:HAMP domain-containing protein